jgi:glycosyltransferase involved in cell wall biosynthesis
MLTIIQCVNNLDIGGAERLVLALSRELTATGHSTLIACIEEAGGLAAAAQEDGLSVVAFHAQRHGKLATIQALRALARQHRPSVIHSHNFKPCFYGAVARLTGAAVGHVQTRHGIFTRAPKNHRWYRTMRPGVDRFVAVSTESQQMLAHITGLSVERVPVILNGVDTSQFSPVPDRRALRATLGLPLDVLAIVSVARLAPEKDFGTMLRAFALVRQYRQDVELWIVGDGPQRAALEQQAQGSGLSSAVRLFGVRTDIEQVLPAADIFSLSSISEGLPIAVLEAGAAGLPIVATAVGEIPHMVNPPECGLVVNSGAPQPLAAAYLELLRNPARRAQMGAAARQRVVEHFSLETMCRQYAELYEELLQRSSNPSSLRSLCLCGKINKPTTHE